MKKLYTLILLFAMALPLSAQMVMTWDEAYAKADELISTLTLDEKIHMTRGYSSFYFPKIEEKGIPLVYLSDATQGVRINRSIPDTTSVRLLPRSTAFPCPVMLAATFNPALAKDYGYAVGRECNAGNIRVLLGPGMNIYRDSQCGRNFEYMGEDPYLAARMVENYVEGMQSTGTAACLKHFVCNNIEYNRRTMNAIVDERTLHEIYMPAFQAGVDAGVAFIMTSYNLVNGEWCGQSSYVIKDLIRKDLGFKGAVMTDWKSVYDVKKLILSGQNIEMPGTDWNVTTAQMYQLIANGEIAESDIENMIRPLIATCLAFNLYDVNAYDRSLISEMPKHAADSYNVAAEGVVLLKNNGILPLAPAKVSNILVCGEFLDEMPRGLGSAKVIGYDNITLREALTKTYGSKVRFVEDPTVEQLESASCVIVSCGTLDSESHERPFALPAEQNALVEAALNANRNTVVLVNSGSGIEMTAYEPKAAGIIYGWYPGQAGMTAIADVISGKVNPSGKLPMSIEKTFADSPSFKDIPADAQLGKKNQTEWGNKILNADYCEGVFVGYRWYQSRNIEPLYPFGFGLSYTKFALGKPALSSKVIRDGETIKISVPVYNKGKREGAEVVQLYVGEANPTVARPAKELKSFAKVTVPAGKKGVAELEIAVKDLAFWDVESHGWKVNPGKYNVFIGTSSANTPIMVEIVKK